RVAWVPDLRSRVQVGFTRLAHLEAPISGKPEIGRARSSGTRDLRVAEYLSYRGFSCPGRVERSGTRHRSRARPGIGSQMRAGRLHRSTLYLPRSPPLPRTPAAHLGEHRRQVACPPSLLAGRFAPVEQAASSSFPDFRPTILNRWSWNRPVP